jgi:hypothetical protein
MRHHWLGLFELFVPVGFVVAWCVLELYAGRKDQKSDDSQSGE